jgi:hypothetical protein
MSVNWDADPCRGCRSVCPDCWLDARARACGGVLGNGARYLERGWSDLSPTSWVPPAFDARQVADVRGYVVELPCSVACPRSRSWRAGCRSAAVTDRSDPSVASGWAGAPRSGVAGFSGDDGADLGALASVAARYRSADVYGAAPRRFGRPGVAEHHRSGVLPVASRGGRGRPAGDVVRVLTPGCRRRCGRPSGLRRRRRG